MYENNPEAFHPKLDGLLDKMLGGPDDKKKHTTGLFYNVGRLHPEVGYIIKHLCVT